MAKKSGMKLIANNKKAFHDYFIEDTYEAGIALAGTEVKSLRSGKCSIKEAFVRVENGEEGMSGKFGYAASAVQPGKPLCFRKRHMDTIGRLSKEPDDK